MPHPPPPHVRHLARPRIHHPQRTHPVALPELDGREVVGDESRHRPDVQSPAPADHPPVAAEQLVAVRPAERRPQGDADRLGRLGEGVGDDVPAGAFGVGRGQGDQITRDDLGGGHRVRSEGDL
ncbi:hypothetical protein [Streptomyces sp. NPDC101455]|uniref:hypothetical protein n=1 Tax=Streptomyces sp. NPDC101455 TaxID=3366142 RepID=UPI00381B7624